MNIVETQAKTFIKDLYRLERRILNMELLKERIDDKLINFKRNRDKLDFLKVLKVEIENDLRNHLLTCSNSNCGYENQTNIALFLVSQEVDYINETYTYIPKSEDQFSVEEETSSHNKLNEILERLNKQGVGQEIIFEEIESLKNHFNLGKKTWFQLAYGKVFSVTGDKMIGESVSKEIINQITDMFHDSIKLIP